LSPGEREPTQATTGSRPRVRLGDQLPLHAAREHRLFPRGSYQIQLWLLGVSLVEAIRKVHHGGRFVSPSLAERLASDIATGRTAAPHESLSDRDYEVLCPLGSGRTVKEIAGELDLSPKTVSTYRARLLEKMRSTSNADLVPA